jgi:hypothetical protein
MKRARWFLLSAGLLVGFLAVVSALGADRNPATPQLTPGRDVYPLPRPGSMNVGLQVLVHGQPLRTIYYGGKTYLPVPQWGTEYTIRVSNHGPRRILAIVSVDGLSVIDGQRASGSSPGYVIEPSSQVAIKGWRRNLSTVAAFSFEGREESYAYRMGYPENVGVIGLLAIEEKGPPVPLAFEQKAAGSASMRRLDGHVGGTGTGYGRDLDSPAYYVTFIRGANRRTITFYYDTVDALHSAGVPVDRPYPSPFPGDSEFAPPPPGHKGR